MGFIMPSYLKAGQAHETQVCYHQAYVAKFPGPSSEELSQPVWVVPENLSD